MIDLDNIVNIDDYKPHGVAEVICLYCMNHWISVYEQEEWLAHWKCPNCVILILKKRCIK